MKGKIGLSLLITVICLAAYLVWSNVSNKREVITIFPSFSLPEINENLYSDKQIDFNKPTIVIIVTTDCGTCNALLENFVNEKLDSVNLIIMTFDKKMAVEISNRMNYKNFKVLLSANNYLEEKFGKSTISSVFIYNTKKELIKHYIGSISPLKYIQ